MAEDIKRNFWYKNKNSERKKIRGYRATRKPTGLL
jgi:hypothetical protein